MIVLVKLLYPQQHRNISMLRAAGLFQFPATLRDNLLTTGQWNQ